jgi:polyphosphate glucokinase
MSAMTGSATDSATVPETAASGRVTGPSRGFGIDIGGSGIKGCPVDLVAGKFAAERHRTPTPSPSTPTAVAGVVAEIVASFGDAAGTGPIGVTFPAVIQRGVARTAANVDKSWIGTDVESLLQSVLGRPVRVVNDADAAGYAVPHRSSVPRGSSQLRQQRT